MGFRGLILALTVDLFHLYQETMAFTEITLPLSIQEKKCQFSHHICLTLVEVQVLDTILYQHILSSFRIHYCFCRFRNQLILMSIVSNFVLKMIPLRSYFPLQESFQVLYLDASVHFYEYN